MTQQPLVSSEIELMAYRGWFEEKDEILRPLHNSYPPLRSIGYIGKVKPRKRPIPRAPNLPMLCRNPQRLFLHDPLIYLTTDHYYKPKEGLNTRNFLMYNLLGCSSQL